MMDYLGGEGRSIPTPPPLPTPLQIKVEDGLIMSDFQVIHCVMINLPRECRVQNAKPQKSIPVV